MATSLTIDELHAALTGDQIARAKSEGMGDAVIDPVDEEMAAACAKVDAYTGGYAVADVLLRAYARDIAAFQVAKRLGAATDNQTKAYDRALRELEDIRDGKFSHLAVTDAAATNTAGSVAYGSDTKILGRL